MKSTVLPLFFLLIPITIFATHNRAGEIIYKQIADNTIEATIVTYAKTSSIQADRDSLIICWGDGTCNFLIRSNGSGIEEEHDFKINYYTGVHRYEMEGIYSISMTDPNRNGGILNVNPPNSDRIQFHLESMITVLPTMTSNHSPTLLESPIDIGFVRQPFMHTPNAIDLDGDSIAYELITPLMENGVPVPNYMQVDQIGAGIENTYTFDETTGLFTWNSPQVVGEYNIAIKVKAYRNGELIDMLIRDMQILIMSDENRPPELTENNLPTELMEVKAGEEVSFEFRAMDPEDGSVDGAPTVTMTGGALQQGAIFESTPGWGFTESTFKWKVGNEDVSTRPYQFAVKLVDSQGLSIFKIIQIKVNPFSTSIAIPFKELGYQLFPNPSSADTYLQLPDNQINKSISIFIHDQLGRLVQSTRFDQATKLIRLETALLPKGNYLINIQTTENWTSSILTVQ